MTRLSFSTSKELRRISYLVQKVAFSYKLRYGDECVLSQGPRLQALQFFATLSELMECSRYSFNESHVSPRMQSMKHVMV